MSPAISTMSASETPRQRILASDEPRLGHLEIDVSCRRLLLLLFNSALVWVTIALGLLLISSIKLHAPGFLADTAWLTLGRVRPAGINAFLYGFASQMAMGVMIWLLCRLGGNRLFLPFLALVGAILWNVGVTIGILSILAGFSTGFEWLEMPASVGVVLLISYALVGASAGVSFHYRRERDLYVSQWFLVGALFWFPWVYSAANLLLLAWPPRGTVQNVIDAWFTNNLLGLWLAPVALAAIFYFIPKLLERPLYNWWLAVFGFWTLAFFTNWSGLTSLVGGPVPAWMTSASIAANVLMIVPLLSAILNWHHTAAGVYSKLWANWTLRYIALGAGAYVLATLLGIVLALREVSVFTNFTYLVVAQRQLALWGFLAITLFGAMHYILPRLLLMDWPARIVRLHFWLSCAGIALIVLALTIGGLVQASGLQDPLTLFPKVMRSTVPFIGVATLGWLVLLAAQCVLLVGVQSMLHRYTSKFRKETREFLMGLPQTGPEVRP